MEEKLNDAEAEEFVEDELFWQEGHRTEKLRAFKERENLEQIIAAVERLQTKYSNLWSTLVSEFADYTYEQNWLSKLGRWLLRIDSRIDTYNKLQGQCEDIRKICRDILSVREERKKREDESSGEE